MTLAGPVDDVPAARASSSAAVQRFPGLAVAAAASLGAGAVHAAATGIHAEHPQLARLFVACAVLQLAAGIVALVRPSRAVAWAVAGVNALAVAGWSATRLTGISWIDGLEVRESPQFADTACAVLGAVAVGGAVAAALIGRRPAVPARHLLPGLAAAAIAVPAMLLGGTHVHSHDAGQTATADESQPHAHTTDPSGTTSPPPAVVAYDPTKPIDLGGIAGVTPQQQAAAENLVAVNVVRLPQWADFHVAEAAGFHSIGDGLTGHEHFINWQWIDDAVTLNPDFPESLVYEPQPDGSKKLVSAMYMLPHTVALADVPDIGGALMQWHIHDNLCFTDDPVAPRVAGLVSPRGTCPTGLHKLPPSPMIHVWIVPNACGPFAALEGVAAGQIQPGEERLCDHAHGTGLLD